MDPNANLAEQEDLRTQVGPLDSYERARLFDLRDKLSRWLKRGGYEPDWSTAPHARKYYGK